MQIAVVRAAFLSDRCWKGYISACTRGESFETSKWTIKSGVGFRGASYIDSVKLTVVSCAIRLNNSVSLSVFYEVWSIHRTILVLAG